MTTEPLPDCWRSEAFAEDLCEHDADGGSQPQQGNIVSRLAGMLPLTLAAVAAAFSTWRSTAA